MGSEGFRVAFSLREKASIYFRASPENKRVSSPRFRAKPDCVFGPTAGAVGTLIRTFSRSENVPPQVLRLLFKTCKIHGLVRNFD